MPSSTPLGSLMSTVLPPDRVTRCGFRRRRVLERDRKPIGDVGALLRRARRPPAKSAEAAAAALAAAAAEQAFEKVGKVDFLAAEPNCGAAGTARAAARSRRGGRSAAAAAIAERRAGIALLVNLAAIVLGALGLVGEDVIGAGDGGETLRRLRIVLVLVRDEAPWRACDRPS